MYWNAWSLGAGGWPTCPAATCAFCCSMACVTSGGRQALRLSHLLGVEPDSHRVVALAEVGDVADADEPGQFIAQLDGRVIADRLQQDCPSVPLRGPTRAAVLNRALEYRLMIINWLGDFFLTVTPRRFTRSGSTGSARLTRFCTSTCAMFRSMPGLNVTVSE